MDVLLPIARNTTLLLSLAFVYTLFIPAMRRLPATVQDYSTGIFFGIFAILTVLDSIAMTQISMFDARYVILMLSTMLAGWRGGFTALIITMIFCWFFHDANHMAQFSAMTTSIIIGGVVYYYHRGDIPSIFIQIITGIILAFVPMFWALVFPYDFDISLKVIIISTYVVLFPLTILVLTRMVSLSHEQLTLTRQLTMSQKRQKAIFEQTPLAILFMTPDGLIEDLNDAMTAVIGLEKHQVIGKHYDAIPWIWTDETTQRLISLIVAAQKGDFVRSTFEFLRDDEQTVLDTSFLPLTDNNQTLSLIVIEAHNITSEIGSKQNQLALQFERERNQILQDLIADASHHLRTPLAIMGSSTYLIRRQLEQKRTDENSAVDDKIHNQFERLETARLDLNGIVEDLLNLMRLDNMSQHKFVIADLTHFVRDNIEGYRELTQKNNQTFTVILNEDVLSAQIVPEVLRRMVQNLVENAIRYTPENGTITVTLQRDQQSAVLQVSDTGIGIPEKDLPRIFDRFYRAGNALAQSRKGTGLGLAITKKVVELHEGTITLESEENKGSTFIVRLPLLETTASTTN